MLQERKSVPDMQTRGSPKDEPYGHTCVKHVQQSAADRAAFFMYYTHNDEEQHTDAGTDVAWASRGGTRMKLQTLVCGLGLVAAFGCDRRRDNRTGETTTTNAEIPGISNDAALTQLVQARCDREMTCNNIGADKKYGTRDQCLTTLRANAREDLNPAECPRGIDQHRLSDCLQEVRNETCNNPLDTVSRLTACRAGGLCLKTNSR